MPTESLVPSNNCNCGATQYHASIHRFDCTIFDRPVTATETTVNIGITTDQIRQAVNTLRDNDTVFNNPFLTPLTAEGQSALFDIKETVALTCPDCHKDIPISALEFRFVGDTKVCTDCFKENYFQCQACQCHYKDITVINDEIYCLSCVNDLGENNNTFLCADCDNIIHINYSYRLNGGRYCEPCYDEKFFNCDNCGDTTLLSNRYESNGDSLCSGCYNDDHQDNDDNFRSEINEDIYISPTFKQTYNIKRKFGVEIECYNKNRCDAPIHEGFEVVDDGSLNNGKGEEYRSGIFQGDRGIEYIEEQCKDLQDNGYKVDSSCGLHVHIDAHDLSEVQLLNITSFIVAFEKLIYALLPKSRRTGSYSQELPYNKDRLNQEKNYLAEQKPYALFKKDVLKNIDRYRGFNLQSIAKHGTIEFRYHSGTIDGNKINQWVNLCLRIVEYQKEIFWDRDRRFSPSHKSAWDLFYSTLQLNNDQIAYFEERRAKFKHELEPVAEEN